MDDYPRMLYRFPASSPWVAQLQDGVYDIVTVDDKAAQDEALKAGYFMTSPEARGAFEKPAKPVELVLPSRADMELKAKELDIKFDGRTSDRKLADLIAATLET